MEEKRKIKRRHLIYYLRVFNRDTNRLLGHLVDITPEGIMLISEEPIETGELFQLRMILPAEIDKRKDVDFQAISLWCKKDVNPDFYDSGFRLVDVSNRDVILFEQLIRNFAMDREA